jgi:GTP cyclohydrolase FolE2
MKNHTSVTVEVELSASQIERFTEQIPNNSQCPASQAIANVKDRLKKRGVKYPHLLNYWAS